MNGNLTPKTVMLYFEIGAMEAFKKTFRDIKIHNCHFRFEQSFWRHIQDVVYQNNKKRETPRKRKKYNDTAETINKVPMQII